MNDPVERFNVSWRDVMSGRLTKKELAESYDSIVDVYNQVCPIESFLPLLEAFFKLDLPKDVRILDLCSGTGRLGQLLQGRGGYTNIDALDCSEKSIEKAQVTGCFQNCYKTFFDPVENGNLASESYDVVFVCNSFQPNHISSLYFSEITRIIKKGGYFVFKIREAYTMINELKVFERDVDRYVAEGKWKPSIDMFKVEPLPGYRGPDGSRYISQHYVMQIM